MTWETWLLFVITEGALCIGPGPAVLLVVSQGLSHGKAKSIWSNSGILVANALYFIISATSAMQIAILGITSLVLEFFVLLGYGSLAGRATRLTTQPRFARVTSRLAGSLLIGAGVGLAAIRK